nr:hypothetical protein [Haladaptatus sp. R4]
MTVRDFEVEPNLAVSVRVCAVERAFLISILTGIRCPRMAELGAETPLTMTSGASDWDRERREPSPFVRMNWTVPGSVERSCAVESGTISWSSPIPSAVNSPVIVTCVNAGEDAPPRVTESPTPRPNVRARSRPMTASYLCFGGRPATRVASDTAANDRQSAPRAKYGCPFRTWTTMISGLAFTPWSRSKSAYPASILLAIGYGAPGSVIVPPDVFASGARTPTSDPTRRTTRTKIVSIVAAGTTARQRRTVVSTSVRNRCIGRLPVRFGFETGVYACLRRDGGVIVAGRTARTPAPEPANNRTARPGTMMRSTAGLTVGASEIRRPTMIAALTTALVTMTPSA